MNKGKKIFILGLFLITLIGILKGEIIVFKDKSSLYAKKIERKKNFYYVFFNKHILAIIPTNISIKIEKKLFLSSPLKVIFQTNNLNIDNIDIIIKNNKESFLKFYYIILFSKKIEIKIKNKILSYIDSYPTEANTWILINSLFRKDIRLNAMKILIKFNKKHKKLEIPDKVYNILKRLKNFPKNSLYLIKIFSYLNYPSIVPFFIDILDRRYFYPDYLIIEVLKTLGKLKSTQVLDIIMEFLEDDDFCIRKEAIITLGRIGVQTDKILEKLIFLLKKEKNKKIKVNIIWTLRKLTQQNFPPYYEVWKEWYNNKIFIENKMKNIIDLLENSENEKELIKELNNLNKLNFIYKDIKLLNKLLKLLNEILSYQYFSLRLKKIVCIIVSKLKTKESIKILIEQLENKDKKIKNLCYNRLKIITGYNLPPKRDIWEIWIEALNDKTNKKLLKLLKLDSFDKEIIILKKLTIKELIKRREFRSIKLIKEYYEKLKEHIEEEKQKNIKKELKKLSFSLLYIIKNFK